MTSLLRHQLGRRHRPCCLIGQHGRWHIPYHNLKIKTTTNTMLIITIITIIRTTITVDIIRCTSSNSYKVNTSTRCIIDLVLFMITKVHQYSKLVRPCDSFAYFRTRRYRQFSPPSRNPSHTGRNHRRLVLAGRNTSYNHLDTLKL